MNAKKTLGTLAAGTLLLAAAPAFAEPPRWAPAYGYRNHSERVVVVKQRPVREVRTVVVREPVVVRRTVFVERPVYVQPRPVYVREPMYAPAPVYAGYGNANVLGTLGGAIIGAAIGSQVGHGNGRTAATAIGAVVGGAIGSQSW